MNAWTFIQGINECYAKVVANWDLYLFFVYTSYPDGMTGWAYQEYEELKESIYVKLKWLIGNRGGVLSQYLLPTDNAAMRFSPQTA